MEKISRENYEIWFMDYMDGRLSETENNQVLDFLIRNADLMEELRKLDTMTLVPGSEAFPEKSSLLKNDQDIPGIPRQDHRCIARMEDDLADEQALEFDRQIEIDPVLGGKYAQYLLTRLKKDESIVYPDRQALKKKRIILNPWVVSVISAAAMIAVVLILWPRNEADKGPLVAEQQDTVKSPAGKSVVPETPDRPVTAGITITPATQDRVKPSTMETLLASSNRQPSTNSSRSQEITVRTTGPEMHELPARPFIPMESLANYFYRPSVSIPNPVSTRVLFASSLPVPGAYETVNPDKDYQSLPQYALQLFRERILGEDPHLVRRTRFTAWEVADAGLEKFNALVGSDMNLDRQYGDDGNLVAVSFNSRLIDFEKPVKGYEK